MQRRVAPIVGPVHVAVAQLPGQLDGFERLFVGPGALAQVEDADTGGDHQRRRVARGRQPRVGAVLRQQAHERRVGVLGGQQIRRRPDAVQVVPLAVVEPLGLPRVRIRAVVQQEAGERQRVDPVEQHHRRHALAGVRPPRVGQLVQGRPALLGPVRVGAALDEVLRQREVPVHHREDQGARARVRVARPRRAFRGVGPGGGRPDRVVDVRARREQRAHRVGLARAHREQQRRPARGRPLVDVRAELDQRMDGGRVVLGGGPVQRGLAAPAFPGAEVGAARQQQPQHVDVAGARRRHQHRLALRQGRVRVGAGGEERLDDRRAPAAGGEDEGRYAVAVGGFGVRSRPEQKLRRLDVAPVRRPVQRRRAVGLGGVDVGLALQQGADGVGVRRLRGVDQRQVPARGGRRRQAGDRRADEYAGHEQNGMPRPERSVLSAHFLASSDARGADVCDHDAMLPHCAPRRPSGLPADAARSHRPAVDARGVRRIGG